MGYRELICDWEGNELACEGGRCCEHVGETREETADTFEPYVQGVAAIQFTLASIVLASLIYCVVRDYLELQQRLQRQHGDVAGPEEDAVGAVLPADNDDLILPVAAPEGTPPHQFLEDPPQVQPDAGSNQAAAAVGRRPGPLSIIQVSNSPMTFAIVDRAVAGAVGMAAAAVGMGRDQADTDHQPKPGSSTGSSKQKKMRHSRKYQLPVKPTRTSDAGPVAKLTASGTVDVDDIVTLSLLDRLPADAMSSPPVGTADPVAFAAAASSPEGSGPPETCTVMRPDNFRTTNTSWELNDEGERSAAAMADVSSAVQKSDATSNDPPIQDNSAAPSSTVETLRSLFDAPSAPLTPSSKPVCTRSIGVGGKPVRPSSRHCHHQNNHKQQQSTLGCENGICKFKAVDKKFHICDVTSPAALLRSATFDADTISNSKTTEETDSNASPADALLTFAAWTEEATKLADPLENEDQQVASDELPSTSGRRKTVPRQSGRSLDDGRRPRVEDVTSESLIYQDPQGTFEDNLGAVAHQPRSFHVDASTAETTELDEAVGKAGKRASRETAAGAAGRLVSSATRVRDVIANIQPTPTPSDLNSID